MHDLTATEWPRVGLLVGRQFADVVWRAYALGASTAASTLLAYLSLGACMKHTTFDISCKSFLGTSCCCIYWHHERACASLALKIRLSKCLYP